MKKILISFTLLVSIFVLCISCTPKEKYIVFKVTDLSGNPIEGVSVYGGKHPDGIEIAPAPKIGETDANGELKWSPDELGEQLIEFAYTFTDGNTKCIDKRFNITKEDTVNHTTYHITYSSES